MASGVPPYEPGLVTRDVPTPMPGNRPARTPIGGSQQIPCTICGEPDPVVSYIYTDKQVIRLHAACDALWMQERPRPE